MEPGRDRPGAGVGRAAGWVVVLDVTAKVLLLLLMLRVAIDPSWGNLEGKAPGTRAMTYPLLAFLVPAVFLARRLQGEFPWGADLLLTVPAFSDVLGNRLDMYDSVVWFDDLVHVTNVGFLAAAILLLSGVAEAPLHRRIELAVAVGASVSLLWEIWEYFAFVTRSGEMVNAYADTLGDLGLGWAGAVGAAFLVGVFRTQGPKVPTPAPWREEELLASPVVENHPDRPHGKDPRSSA